MIGEWSTKSMKKGFTLAEILIVLFILGAVSLLTVPSLIDMYRFRVYSAQFNRAYSQIGTAFSQLMQDEMSYSETSARAAEGLYATKYGHINLASHEIYEDFLRNYLNAVSVFEGKQYTSPSGDPYKLYHWPYPDLEYINLNGESWRNYAKFKLPDSQRLFSSNQGACGKLPQGATVCVGYTTGDTQKRIHMTPLEGLVLNNGQYTKTNTRSVDKGAILVWLDTNGSKPPNATGYDFFIMQVNTDGTLSEVYICDDNCPEGTDVDPWNNPTSYTAHTTPSSQCALVGAESPGSNLNRAQKAYGCLSRIFENGGKITKFKN